MDSNIKEVIDSIILKHFGFQPRIELSGFTSRRTILNSSLF